MGLAEDLLERSATISDALKRCEIINDVLEDNVLSRRQQAQSSSALSSMWNSFLKVLQINNDDVPSGLYYLPKGKFEPMAEYIQRLSMTPWFPKTPQILNDRQGALFNKPPKFEGDLAEDETFKAFEQSATKNGLTLLAVIAHCSELMQNHGFYGVFVDRKVTDKTTASMLEVKQEKLGLPQLVIYPAEQIYWIERDAIGLKWVKTVETHCERSGWNAPETKYYIVRIFDRENIISYRIDEKDGNRTVTNLGIFKHGFTDKNKNPRIPFVIGSAFQGRDGLGRPSLLGPAQADVAATRVLSDIVWNLFVAGNPTLCFHTDRDEKELKKFIMGVTRYIPLKLGDVNKDGESLEYIQLDTAGIEKLVEMYFMFCQKAEEQAGADAPGAVTQPLEEQSGISRAWQFKTGEERILFLITRQLQDCFNQVMDIVAVDLGKDPEKISIKFNEKFEVIDPKKEAETAKLILPMVTASQIATAEITKRVVKQAYPELPNMEEIEKELDDVEPITPREELEMQKSVKVGDERK